LKQKEIERKSLIVSSIVSLIITILGLSIYIITDIQVVFLDCFFAFIALISSLVAFSITKKSKIKTKTHPEGLYFLEPLFAILKSLLTLFLLIFSLISTWRKAYKYFIYKVGVPINTNIVISYVLCMMIICFSLGLFHYKQNMKINNISTILEAEIKANLIDGFQSLGVVIVFIFLTFIDINSKLGFLHYTTDFFITTILVLILLKEPFKVIISSFKEISSGTTNNLQITNKINKIINDNLDNILINKQCNIFKIGTKIKIQIKIMDDLNNNKIKKLKILRNKIIKKLNLDYENIELIYIF